MKKVLGWKEKVNFSPPYYTSGTDYGYANLKIQQQDCSSPFLTQKSTLLHSVFILIAMSLESGSQPGSVSFFYLFFFFLSKFHSVMKVDPWNTHDNNPALVI